MDTVEDYAALDSIARQVARHVARNNKHMELEDLVQEAWVALLNFTIPRFNPEFGVPFRAWAWKTTVRPCTWRAAANGSERIKRRELEETVRNAGADTLAHGAAREDDAPGVDEVVLEKRWREAVVDEVRRLLEEAAEDNEDSSVELMVLMEEMTAKDAAVVRGVSAKTERERVHRLRRRIAKDATLRGLWEEK